MQDILNSILADFRGFVVSVDEENRELRKKLKGLHLSPPNSIATTTTNTLTSAGTLSSNAKTTSTGPPPYKSVVVNKHKAQHQQQETNNREISKPQRQRRISLDSEPHYHNHPQPSLPPPPPPPRPPIRRKASKIKQSKSMSAQRGALIVLEGLDRVGKSTLANKLVEHLERIRTPVQYHKFPNRSTQIGQLIDELLRNSSRQIDDHAMHLLFSANRWELNQKMRKTIQQGTTIIVDRYSYSGIAYSCAKRSELSLEWCREMEKGLPKPDLIIYLELGKESQYKRPGFGDERFEVRDFQELIRKQYESLIKLSREEWLRVDVDNKGPEQVLGEVILPVNRCIETCADKPLGDLDFK